MAKKIILKAVDVLSVTIIALAALVLLMVFLTKPGQAPRILGYSVFRVLTGSMTPEIPRDTLLVVRQTDAGAVAVGDVITFYSTDPALAGAVNTHRVVSVEQDGGSVRFITKGDANQIQDDYPVESKNLIGKVVFKSQLLGKLARLASNPLFALVVIAIPLLIILFTTVRRTVLLARTMAREEETLALEEARKALQARQRQKAEAKTGEIQTQDAPDQ